MEKSIRSRYASTADGKIALDVTADKVQDLYSNFDKTAPYLRKDLDIDLAEYLAECAQEIGDEPFAVRFALAQAPDEDLKARVRKSVEGYFLYLLAVERGKLAHDIRSAMLMLSAGIVILSFAVWANRLLAGSGIAGQVFAEGLTVAAWVSLWEALATVLVRCLPRRRELRVFDHLAHAPVLFCAPEELATPA